MKKNINLIPSEDFCFSAKVEKFFIQKKFLYKRIPVAPSESLPVQFKDKSYKCTSTFIIAGEPKRLKDNVIKDFKAYVVEAIQLSFSQKIMFFEEKIRAQRLLFEYPDEDFPQLIQLIVVFGIRENFYSVVNNLPELKFEVHTPQTGVIQFI